MVVPQWSLNKQNKIRTNTDGGQSEASTDYSPQQDGKLWHEQVRTAIAALNDLGYREDICHTKEYGAIRNAPYIYTSTEAMRQGNCWPSLTGPRGSQQPRQSHRSLRPSPCWSQWAQLRRHPSHRPTHRAAERTRLRWDRARPGPERRPPPPRTATPKPMGRRSAGQGRVAPRRATARGLRSGTARREKRRTHWSRRARGAAPRPLTSPSPSHRASVWARLTTGPPSCRGAQRWDAANEPRTWHHSASAALKASSSRPRPTRARRGWVRTRASPTLPQPRAALRLSFSYRHRRVPAHSGSEQR